MWKIKKSNSIYCYYIGVFHLWHIKYKFFSIQECTNYEERKQYVTSIVSSIGEQLIDNLIQASVFSLQTYMLPDVIDVIIELMAYDKDVRI